MDFKNTITHLTFVLSILSLNSYAAVIYDEADSGDLGGLFEPQIVLSAVDGVNEIKGSNWSAESSANSAFINVSEGLRDAFSLSVTSTMTITALDIVFSNPVFHTDINGNDGYGTGYVWIKPSTLGGRVGTGRNIVTNGVHVLPDISFIDQAVTLYEVHHSIYSTPYGGVCTPDCTWDYTIRITIEDSAPPVPVPAAVWLFGSGLLGLIGVARRKKA